jgi:hypothetical protein
LAPIQGARGRTSFVPILTQPLRWRRKASTMKKQITDREQIIKLLKKGRKAQSGDSYFGDADERFLHDGENYAYGSTLSMIPGTIQWETDGAILLSFRGYALPNEVVEDYKRLKAQQKRCTYTTRLGSSFWHHNLMTVEEHNSQVVALERRTGLSLKGLKGPIRYLKMWGA